MVGIPCRNCKLLRPHWHSQASPILDFALPTGLERTMQNSREVGRLTVQISTQIDIHLAMDIESGHKNLLYIQPGPSIDQYNVLHSFDMYTEN